MWPLLQSTALVFKLRQFSSGKELFTKQEKESSGNCKDRLGKNEETFLNIKVKQLFKNFHWSPEAERNEGSKKGAEVYGSNGWFSMRVKCKASHTHMHHSRLSLCFYNSQATDNFREQGEIGGVRQGDMYRQRGLGNVQKLTPVSPLILSLIWASFRDIVRFYISGWSNETFIFSFYILSWNISNIYIK